MKRTKKEVANLESKITKAAMDGDGEAVKKIVRESGGDPKVVRSAIEALEVFSSDYSRHGPANWQASLELRAEFAFTDDVSDAYV